jgi:hypothetical protein
MSSEGELSQLKSLPNKNEHVRTKMNESNAVQSAGINLYSGVYLVYLRCFQQYVFVFIGVGRAQSA